MSASMVAEAPREVCVLHMMMHAVDDASRSLCTVVRPSISGISMSSVMTIQHSQVLVALDQKLPDLLGELHAGPSIQAMLPGSMRKPSIRHPSSSTWLPVGSAAVSGIGRIANGVSAAC